MEVYKRETREILRRFRDGRLNYAQCIAALDDALGALMPILRPDQLGELRPVILANNEEVLQEQERRGATHPRTSY